MALGEEFRRQLRAELEQLGTGKDAATAVDTARGADDAGQVPAAVGAPSDEYAVDRLQPVTPESGSATAPVYRVFMIRDGRRESLGTIPASRAVAPNGSGQSVPTSATQTHTPGAAHDPDGGRAIPGPDTSNEDVSQPPRERQKRITKHRRSKAAGRVVLGEVVEGGRVVEQPEVGEDELTLGDKARWALAALRNNVAKAGAVVQDELAATAKRRMERKKQEEAEQKAADEYFYSLHPEVQRVLRELQALESMHLMVSNGQLLHRSKVTLHKYGFDIDAYGYLVELPKPDPRPPRRPSEWPHKDPGYRRPQS